MWVHCTPVVRTESKWFINTIPLWKEKGKNWKIKENENLSLESPQVHNDQSNYDPVQTALFVPPHTHKQLPPHPPRQPPQAHQIRDWSLLIAGQIISHWAPPPRRTPQTYSALQRIKVRGIRRAVFSLDVTGICRWLFARDYGRRFSNERHTRWSPAHARLLTPHSFIRPISEHCSEPTRRS